MIKYLEILKVVHGRKLLKRSYQVGSHAIKRRRQTVINVIEGVILEPVTLFRRTQGVLTCSKLAGAPDGYRSKFKGQ